MSDLTDAVSERRVSPSGTERRGVRPARGGIMRRWVGLFVLAGSLLQVQCLAVLKLMPENDNGRPPGWLALFGLRQPINASGAPTVTLPDGLPTAALVVQESTTPAPDLVGGQGVPVGAPFEITFDTAQIQGLTAGEKGSIVFAPGSFATLTYRYDPAQLQAAGLVEEFVVYYYDVSLEGWYPVDRTEVDPAAGTVTAYTSHFTTFVLTAMPATNGTAVADAPACIAQDFPGGIGGSGAARFTVVDANFKYYQDRNYYIHPTGGFANLSFEGALGVATCNGNSFCGPQSAHKLFTGNDYIDFNAPRAVDVYLMYDTRGGSGPTDTSQDAPWIAALGFTNTGEFVQTTDNVGSYTVYKKTYAQGERILLHGNKQGAAGAVQTNYWLVLKPAGVTGPAKAGSVCSQPDDNAPAPVSDLIAIPGGNRVTLVWRNPMDTDFAGVVVRRAAAGPPMRIADGVPPNGTVLNPESLRDDGVAPGNTYHYTVFALDANQNYGPGKSVSVTTGTDSDTDGLSDTYEDSITYPTGNKSDRLLPDTDNDGTSDADEVAAGTDPTNPDTTAPTITTFALQGSSPTSNPVIRFDLTGTDDVAITGWMIRETSQAPRSYSTGWVATKPDVHVLSSTGTYNLYVWAKDAAGNVSPAVSAVSVELNGIKRPEYAYVSAEGNLVRYRIDAVTGALSSPVAMPQQAGFSNVALHPTGRFVHACAGTGAYAYALDQATGLLTAINNVAAPCRDIAIVPEGDQVLLSGRRIVNSLPNMFERIAVEPTGSLGSTLEATPVIDFGAEGRGAGLALSLGRLLLYRYGSSASLNILSPDPTVGWVISLVETSQGSLSSFMAGLFFVSGGLAINNAGTPVSPAQRPAGRIALDPDGAFVYVLTAGAAGLYGQDANGNIHLRLDVFPRAVSDTYAPAVQSIPLGTVAAGLDSFPGLVVTQNFVYAVEHGYGLAVFSRHSGNGTLTRIQSVPIGAHQLEGLTLDPTGQFLYLADHGTNRVRTYAVDGTTGLLTAAGAPAAVTGPRNTAVYARHDANDPPVIEGDELSYHWSAYSGVRPRPALPGMARAGWGASAVLTVRDPDAVRCGVTPLALIPKLRLVARAPGSSLPLGEYAVPSTGPVRAVRSAQSNLSHSYTIYLAPDAPGDYELEFEITDQPGTCPAQARTTVRKLRLKAIPNQVAWSWHYLHASIPMPAQPIPTLERNSFLAAQGADTQFASNGIMWGGTRMYAVPFIDAYVQTCIGSLCAPRSFSSCSVTHVERCSSQSGCFPTASDRLGPVSNWSDARAEGLAYCRRKGWGYTAGVNTWFFVSTETQVNVVVRTLYRAKYDWFIQ